MRVRGHRPPSPLLPAGRFCVRPRPLPAPAGAEDGRPGPGRSPAGMGPSRGVCHAAPVAGVPDGTKGQAGVRPSAQTAGEIQPGRSAIGGERCPPAGGPELRCGEAPGALPAGGTAAPPRPGALSLPAPGEREHHIGRGLHDIAVGEGGRTAGPRCFWSIT